MRGGGGGVENRGVFEKNSWIFWFFGGFFGGGPRGILRVFWRFLEVWMVVEVMIHNIFYHSGVAWGWWGCCYLKT